MVNKENKIEPTSEIEVGSNQRMCEIRFDALVTMYDFGQRIVRGGVLGFSEKPREPQWFKSSFRLTLENIKYSNEYDLGKQLKIMLEQLEQHIKKYEQ